MDAWTVVVGWGEKVLGAWRHQAATDMRIADQTKLLRRELAASFEDWPRGPQTADELLSWAHKLARGFGSTEPAPAALVERRPEASRKVRRAVGAARDAYYAAANLINPAIKTRWRVTNGDARPEPVDSAPLRRAVAHVRRCIAKLDVASAAKD